MSRNRGKPKPSLRDYSRVRLSSEQKISLIKTIGTVTHHSIVTAILGCVIVEHDLDVLLRRRFKRNDDETWKSLQDEKGPLQTFYSKIVLGYAFKIYDEKVVKDLNIIRTIRNAFAHSRMLLNFEHPKKLKN